ncbi:MAG: hypothetical protein PW788_05630 [Micavibrio sp.]|nr:hypothetical protein [Micavibrio sp.]
MLQQEAAGGWAWFFCKTSKVVSGTLEPEAKGGIPYSRLLYAFK